MLRTALSQLQYEQEKTEIEISKLPEGALNILKRGNRKDFVLNTYSSSGRNRRIISDDVALVKKLCHKKYLLLQLQLISSNLHILEHAYKYAKDTEPDTIIKMLPSTYSRLPVSYFFQNTENYADVDDEDDLYQLYADGKTYITCDGNAVRSKSEADIYNSLSRSGIKFRYEKHLIADGIDFYPDFTIMLPGGSFILWEHAGMMYDEEYRKHHYNKIMHYEKDDIVVWKNLIVTYDYGKHGLPQKIIDGHIEGLILPFLKNKFEI